MAETAERERLAAQASIEAWRKTLITAAGTTFVVTIDVDGSGNFTYGPAVLHITKVDTVKWVCNSGGVALIFPRSPFKKSRFQAGQGAFTEIAEVRNETEPGIYHYAVSVSVGGTIRINSGCPEMIVD